MLPLAFCNSSCPPCRISINFISSPHWWMFLLPWWVWTLLLSAGDNLFLSGWIFCSTTELRIKSLLPKCRPRTELLLLTQLCSSIWDVKFKNVKNSPSTGKTYGRANYLKIRTTHLYFNPICRKSRVIFLWMPDSKLY